MRLYFFVTFVLALAAFGSSASLPQSPTESPTETILPQSDSPSSKCVNTAEKIQREFENVYGEENCDFVTPNQFRCEREFLYYATYAEMVYSLDSTANEKELTDVYIVSNSYNDTDCSLISSLVTDGYTPGECWYDDHLYALRITEVEYLESQWADEMIRDTLTSWFGEENCGDFANDQVFKCERNFYNISNLWDEEDKFDYFTSAEIDYVINEYGRVPQFVTIISGYYNSIDGSIRHSFATSEYATLDWYDEHLYQLRIFEFIEPTEEPTKKPTTIEPTTMKPTTMKPTTMKPTTMKPTTIKPTTMKPTKTRPTTKLPTAVPVPTVVPSFAGPNGTLKQTKKGKKEEKKKKKTGKVGKTLKST